VTRFNGIYTKLIGSTLKVLKTAASSKSINLYLFIKKSIVSSATTTYPFWCKLQEVGGTFRHFCLIRVVTRQKNF
jgi:hypothetical protein